MNTRSKTHTPSIEKSSSGFDKMSIPNNTSYLTRSKTENTPELEVNIDFDESSIAWRSNKCPIGNGCYRYIIEKPVTKSRKVNVAFSPVTTGRYNLRSNSVTVSKPTSVTTGKYNLRSSCM